MADHKSKALQVEHEPLKSLREAIDFVQTNYPIPRCQHGNAIKDGAGDLLEPPCGCRARVVFLDFDARPSPKTSRYCTKCQKDIKPGSEARIVRVHNWNVIHPEEIQNGIGEDWLVGLDCARKIGMEFTRPERAS